MNEILVKKKRKCVPLVITPEIKDQIRIFKERLIDCGNRPDETSEFDANTIDIVINRLDDYDTNLLIAYYTIGDCSASKLAKIFNTSQPVIRRKITLIHDKIKELNDVPKTANNQPRYNPCD